MQPFELVLPVLFLRKFMGVIQLYPLLSCLYFEYVASLFAHWNKMNFCKFCSNCWMHIQNYIWREIQICSFPYNMSFSTVSAVWKKLLNCHSSSSFKIDLKVNGFTSKFKLITSTYKIKTTMNLLFPFAITFSEWYWNLKG